MAVGPYEGIHAFVFIDRVDEGTTILQVVKNLRDLRSDLGQVLFASELVGPFHGFAHVASDDLPGLQKFVFGPVWDQGVHCQYSIEGPVYTDGVTPLGPKRFSPEYVALVRIWTECGRAMGVLNALGSQLEHGTEGGPFVGASIVYGAFDILLQLGSERSFEGVAEPILERLQVIPGVARTETSFVFAEVEYP